MMKSRAELISHVFGLSQASMFRFETVSMFFLLILFIFMLYDYMMWLKRIHEVAVWPTRVTYLSSNLQADSFQAATLLPRIMPAIVLPTQYQIELLQDDSYRCLGCNNLY